MKLDNMLVGEHSILLRQLKEFFELLNGDEYGHLFSVGETRPPVPDGHVDGKTGGYWQDPVSNKWHFIPGAGYYNDKGEYIFQNLFRR